MPLQRCLRRLGVQRHSKTGRLLHNPHSGLKGLESFIDISESDIRQLVVLHTVYMKPLPGQPREGIARAAHYHKVNHVWHLAWHSALVLVQKTLVASCLC